MDKSIDKPLDDIISNDATKKRLINENGSIDIPGTPIILPGRGVVPKNNEYVDSDSNTGVTNDANKIELLKAKHTKEVVENQLLGKFEGNGIYQVSEEVSKELIDMVKIIETEVDYNTNKTIDVEGDKVKVLPGIIYCKSFSTFSGVGNFKFAIQTYYHNLVAISELFLLEDIKKVDGFIQNVNIYSAGKYKATFSASYKNEMFAYFNIVSKETAIKMSEEEKLLFGWAYRRKLYLKNLFLLSNSKYLLAEANYLGAKVETLSSLGAFGTTVIATFNELRGKAKKIINKELTARDLNDLLDMVIENISAKYPENTKQYYATIVGHTRRFQDEIRIATEANKEQAKAKTVEASKGYQYYFKYAEIKKEKKKEKKKKVEKKAEKKVEKEVENNSTGKPLTPLPTSARIIIEKAIRNNNSGEIIAQENNNSDKRIARNSKASSLTEGIS